MEKQQEIIVEAQAGIIEVKEGAKLENYRKLQLIAIAKNRPVVTPFIQIEHISKGKVVSGWRKLAMSWNRNHYNSYVSTCFCVAANDAVWADGNLNVTDTGNTLRNYADFNIGPHPRTQETSGGATSSLMAAATVTTYGIVIGTGINAENFGDHVLQTPIANGAGAGQMNYDAVAVINNWDAGTRIYRYSYSRIMSNVSGGAIDVTEAALYARLGASAVWTVMTNREVFAAETVPDGDSIRVVFDTELTVPAVA